MKIIKPGPGEPHAFIFAESGAALSSIEQSTIVSLFKECGAILLRGFDWNLEDFKQFTKRFCVSSAFNESPGRILLDKQSNIQSVNVGREAFPLHPELSREPWKPDVCFFCCINPPSRGGETLICDGIAIVKNMSRDLFHAFEPRRLLYAQPAAPEICKYWLGTPSPADAVLQHPPTDCPYSFLRANGSIVRIFSRPALHTPMFSTQLAFGNFLLFARYYLRTASFPVFENRKPVPDSLVGAVKEISDAVAVPIRWRKGDIVMLDNTRFMHGRNAIIDAKQRQIASYFGYLKFARPGTDEPPNARWRQPGFKAPHQTGDNN